MAVRYYMPYVIFFFNIQILLLSFFVSVDGAAEGSFKVSLISFNNCEITDYPYIKDPGLTLTLSKDNTTNLLGGVINVKFNVKNVKFLIRSLLWDKDKWRLTFEMPDMNCHGLLYYLIVKTSGVKYDKKDCMFMKGEYPFKGLDPNYVQHIWTSKKEYGKTLWRVEACKPKIGTYICYEFITSTDPI